MDADNSVFKTQGEPRSRSLWSQVSFFSDPALSNGQGAFSVKGGLQLRDAMVYYALVIDNYSWVLILILTNFFCSNQDSLMCIKFIQPLFIILNLFFRI